MTSVLQSWVETLPLMQQSVLISAIRGADGFPKGHQAKPLTRFYRRCILVSAFDKKSLVDPCHPGGGKFTGPSVDEQVVMVQHEGDWVAAMRPVVDAFLQSRDELPLHYWDHQQHAFEIVGYKHPDLKVRAFWHEIYRRTARSLHFLPEPESEMDLRLSDDEQAWRQRDEEGRGRRPVVFA